MFATKTSFEVVAKAWRERNITLYLPTWLPHGLKPTAAWVVIRDGGAGSLAILLFSSVGIDRIATAELAIEVSPMGGIPYPPNITKGYFTTIKGWRAYINEKTPMGWPEYKELYGVDYSRQVVVQMGALTYDFSGAPFLTIEDMIKIVESMEPAKVG